MHEIGLSQTVDEFRIEFIFGVHEQHVEAYLVLFVIVEDFPRRGRPRGVRRAYGHGIRTQIVLVRLEQMPQYEIHSSLEREVVHDPLDEVVHVDKVEYKQPEPQDGEYFLGENVHGHHTLDRMAMQAIA